MIVRLSVVLRRTNCGDVDVLTTGPSWSHHQTTTQVVETSVNVTTNSPSQDYTHLDDRTIPTYDMTPGFKPFTEFITGFPCPLPTANLER